MANAVRLVGLSVIWTWLGGAAQHSAWSILRG